MYTKGKRWVARIAHNGKKHHIGTFETTEEAARAFDQAALAIHGVAANLNFAVHGDLQQAVQEAKASWKPKVRINGH